MDRKLHGLIWSMYNIPHDNKRLHRHRKHVLCLNWLIINDDLCLKCRFNQTTSVLYARTVFLHIQHWGLSRLQTRWPYALPNFQGFFNPNYMARYSLWRKLKNTLCITIDTSKEHTILMYTGNESIMKFREFLCYLLLWYLSPWKPYKQQGFLPLFSYPPYQKIKNTICINKLK